MRHSFAMLTVAFTLSALLIGGCSQPAPSAPPPAPTSVPAQPKATEPPKAAAPTAPPAKPTAAPTAVPKVDFPAKGRSINLIMPWAPGGPTDIAGRVIAAAMEPALGTSISVVNREGAGSQVGLTELVKARPDGYTIATVTNPTAMITYLDPSRQAVFARKDFQPISLYTREPVVLAVQRSGPIKTVKDLVDTAKANPDKAQVGTPQGVLYLSMLALMQATGTKITLIDFVSAPPAITAAIGGHVAGAMSSTSAFAYNRVPEMLPIAVFGDKRDPGLPDTPTLKELGYNVELSSSGGLVAPAGTPKEIIAVLNEAVKKGTDLPETKTKWKNLSDINYFLETAAFDKYWGDLENQVKPLMPLMLNRAQ